MGRRTVLLLPICFCAVPPCMQARDFTLFDRQVQLHGFAAQGLIYTNDNNWLTMTSVHGKSTIGWSAIRAVSTRVDRHGNAGAEQNCRC
ncbi:MAG: hypothetical protein ABSF66_12270 [Terriglobales bacterium]